MLGSDICFEYLRIYKERYRKFGMYKCYNYYLGEIVDFRDRRLVYLKVRFRNGNYIYIIVDWDN